ncbi:putative FAM45 family protein [Paratrimastix pyriformis]|uniref:FAM45 family protein n=1 Tax=Paratrimastix pyriformis TaxID=342808 RepID=A0ABQ8UK09_9EUKA|nr:putative FAM45 family protein [Paratrimastix pyriformis]
MEELEGLAIFEKDTGGATHLVWAFPNVPSAFEQILRERSQINADNIETPFLFSKWKQWYHYTVTVSVPHQGFSSETPDPLPAVDIVSVSLLTKIFNPERYGCVVKMLSTVYLEGGRPPEVLASYLRLMATESCRFRGEPFAPPPATDQRKSLIRTPLVDLTGPFGGEAVLLWHAALTCRSVLIYAPSIPQLLSLLRAFPLLAFHRQNWELLRPYVTLSPTEQTTDLLPCAHGEAGAANTPVVLGPGGVLAGPTALGRPQRGLVAGTCSPIAKALMRGEGDNPQGLWEVMVDLETHTIVLADGIQGAFDGISQCPLHREAAKVLLQAAQQVKQALPEDPQSAHLATSFHICSKLIPLSRQQAAAVAASAGTEAIKGLHRIVTKYSFSLFLKFQTYYNFFDFHEICHFLGALDPANHPSKPNRNCTGIYSRSWGS